jgi:hypothetical protein
MSEAQWDREMPENGSRDERHSGYQRCSSMMRTIGPDANSECLPRFAEPLQALDVNSQNRRERRQ